MAGSKDGKKKPRAGRKRRRRKNQVFIAAVTHPLRQKVLLLMADGRKASASELAKTLNEPLSTVAYHVRVLSEGKALKRASKRQVRGATQRFYRRTEMPAWVREMLGEDEQRA